MCTELSSWIEVRIRITQNVLILDEVSYSDNGISSDIPGKWSLHVPFIDEKVIVLIDIH